ncbi:MAG: InlB B-repeat-containing protein [Firmicutes bacterium]|nr:InlB B-repeat-containing protein [Bacillota bacterium]
MKKVMLPFLAAVLLLTMTGCRRRIVADAGDAVSETVFQPVPAAMDEQGQQVPDASRKPDPAERKTEIDPDGARVDETIAAEGGETVEQAADARAGEKLTVTLDAMGGQCGTASVTVRTGGVYGVLPTPTYTGQSFQGWFLNPEGGEPVHPVTVVLEDGDHTLYAHWTTRTEFVVTFDPGGGRISPYSAQKTVCSGDVYGQLPEPLRSGYVFLGWFTEPEGGVPILPAQMVTLTDDQTVYAHWEYSPVDYWSFVLRNTTQKIFDCQEVAVYLELEADRVSMAYAPLLADAGVRNIAGQEDAPITDDWVKDKKPDVIVKLAEDMATVPAVKAAMERRFPDARVYVFPTEAVQGTESRQLYWKLRLACVCYPSYYDRLDLNAVAGELDIEP